MGMMALGLERRPGRNSRRWVFLEHGDPRVRPGSDFAVDP